MNPKNINFMANVQKQMKDVSANLDKNAFDLSERHLFSAKCGELLPIYNKQVVPGDYFEIDPVSFLRSQRVNTASYARMRQHVDFFFVPYSQLWHPFAQMKYQRADQTSVLQPNLSTTSPYISLWQLYNQVLMVDDNDPNHPNLIGAKYSSKKNAFGYLEIPLRVKLCDLFLYGNLRDQIFRYTSGTDVYCGYPSSVPGVYGDKHVNIWPWLAYQKIWYDFYRNPFYDVSVQPSNFNVDDIQKAVGQSMNIFDMRVGTFSKYDSRLDGLFTLRYRQWKQDYFTGLFPTRQFGDVSAVVASSAMRLSPAPVTPYENLVLQDDNYVSTAQDLSDALVLDPGISVLDIRRAELLQIWKEKTLRAGNRTEALQRAHFGVGSDYIQDDHVRHLGGYSEVVNISEVVSTSLNNTGITGSDGLGELGGKGTSLGSGEKIRFRAKDDGVIMCIFSILPESEYNSYGLAHDHQRLDPFDYFTPALQNLGFEAVTRSELDIINVGGSYTPHSVLGFAPPYYDMKMGIDRVHGEFTTQQDLIGFSGNIWPTFTLRGGSLQAFDSARRDATKLAGTLPFFYVNPNVVDSIFAANADSFEDTDQFFVNMFFNIKAVRPMSVLGLPNF